MQKPLGSESVPVINRSHPIDHLPTGKYDLARLIKHVGV